MPSRNGSVTDSCQVCGGPLPGICRPRSTCSDTCRQAKWRRLHQPQRLTAPVLPAARSHKAVTVYECADCDTRLLAPCHCWRVAATAPRDGVSRPRSDTPPSSNACGRRGGNPGRTPRRLSSRYRHARGSCGQLPGSDDGLVGERAEIAQRRVPAATVVPAFDVTERGRAKFGDAGPAPPLDQLEFVGPEPGFADGVVPALAGSGQALGDTIVGEQRGEGARGVLAASIGAKPNSV